jgi:hypothetical protein
MEKMLKFGAGTGSNQQQGAITTGTSTSAKKYEVLQVTWSIEKTMPFI